MKKIKCNICELEYTQNDYFGIEKAAECPTTNLLHMKEVDITFWFSPDMRELWLPRREAHLNV